jgi:hypothetical protein
MSIPNSNERIKIFKLSFYLKKKLSYANGITENSTVWMHKKVNIKFLKKKRFAMFLHTILHASEGEGGLIYKLVSDPIVCYWTIKHA